MLKRLVFISLCLFSIVACQQKETNYTAISTEPFFDLATYFQMEINRLEKNKFRLQKKLSLGEKEEEKIVEVFDIQEELAAFSDSNINKTTWLDLYQVDSILVDNKLTALYYTTSKKKLKVKEVGIFFTGTTVDSIQIIKENNSILANTHQKMRYIPTEGFTISNTQEMRFTAEQKLNLKVLFLPES